MRADQHEGELNDSQAKRENDRYIARANEIQTSDLLYLTANVEFLRFFGGFAYPALMQDVKPGSGAALERFMGRREIVLEMIARLDLLEPGFLQRMLEVRKNFEADLRHAAQNGDGK